MDQRLFKYPDAKTDYVKATQDKDQSAAFDLALFYKTTLHDDDKAIEWYKKSYEYGSSRASLNLGNLYFKLQKYNDAEVWFINAYNNGDIKSAYNIGYLYDEVYQNYGKAIEWYEEAYTKGYLSGAYNIAIIYEEKFKNIAKALVWYKKGAASGDADSINNITLIYHNKNNNIVASAYMLAMVKYGYTKKQVIDFLKNDWKIDKNTLEKAYKLQLTLDIPKHYTGGID